MDSVASLTLKLIREELLGDTSDLNSCLPLSHDDLKNVYLFSKHHDMAHLVGDFVINHQLTTDEDVKTQFQKQVYTAIYRYERNKAELEAVIQILNAEKIPHIPLKGAVIREFYPKPWQRTSADIDVLVHEEDLYRAKEAIEKAYHYTFENIGSHDIAGESQNGVHLELHYRLMEEDYVGGAEKPLLRVWDFTTCKPNSYTYSMTRDMFLYYHLVHMAKHFVHGGCGIKPFIDLWVYRKQPLSEEENNSLQRLLTEGKISEFASSCEKIAAIWFEEAPNDDFLEKVSNFVLSGGTYGTVENRVSVQQLNEGSKFRYALSRIWISKKSLAYLYPSLKKRPLLLPFYQFARWISILFSGRLKSGIQELSYNSLAKIEDMEKTKSMLKELHLL